MRCKPTFEKDKLAQESKNLLLLSELSDQNRES